MIGSLDTMTSFLAALMFSGARITAAFIIAPFFGPQLVPGMVRNIVIINLTVIILPVTMATMDIETLDGFLFVSIVAKEIIIGFIMGFIVGITFYVAESMGAFIDTQRGSSMGQIFDPMSGSTSTTLGALMTKIVVVIFFVGGGFMTFLGFMYKSYVIWPLFEFFPSFDNAVIPIYTLQLADHIMRNVVLLAAPISITMFLVEFGLGMMNRFAPQLNVFSLSMPIKSGIAAFMLILYLSTLYVLYENHIHEDHRLLLSFQKIFK